MGKTPKDATIAPVEIITEKTDQSIFERLRDYTFPEEAKQDTQHATRKTKLSGYRFNYLINAMHEVVGMENWSETGEMIKCEKPQWASAFVAIYRSTITVNINGKSRVQSSYGGARNLDEWEAAKGAQTNAIKKCLSMFGLGWKAYTGDMDEDFSGHSIDEKTSAVKLPPPIPTPQSSVVTPPTPAVPAQAPKLIIPTGSALNTTLASTVQKEQIKSIFLSLGYAPEEVPDRLNALATRLELPSFDQITAGQAIETIEKMKAQLTKKQSEQTSIVTE